MSDSSLQLQNPKNNEQEVLLTLIKNGSVSIFDFPYLSGFRTRVSQLRLNYGLNLQRETKLNKNKFGNVFSYAVHNLPEEEKPKALEIYKKITQS